MVQKERKHGTMLVRYHVVDPDPDAVRALGVKAILAQGVVMTALEPGKVHLLLVGLGLDGLLAEYNRLRTGVERAPAEDGRAGGKLRPATVADLECVLHVLKEF